MGFFRNSYMGIDVGFDSIRVVELRVKASQVQVAKAGMIKTPPQAYDAGIVLDPSLLAKNLRKLWRNMGLKKRRPVHIAIGGPRIFYRILTIPVIPKRELTRALEWELEDHFPLSAREAVFDCLPLGNEEGLKGQQGKYLVVAVRREIVAGYLEALSLAGLEARILEPKPLSLLRVLDAGELDKRKKIRLYIMIEYKYITIIISSRGKILFIRVIPWEIGNLGYAKGADAEREILTECRSTLHYYLARGFGARPQQIVLYNEGGGDDHCLLKKLKTEFHLPVRQAAVNRNKLTWIPVIPVGKQYLFAACIGLGLRGVKGNSRY